MKLSTIISALETIAPTAFAEPWDNVGLLVGDAAQDISRIMLTIDYTAAVAAEAKAGGCDLIVSYHPPIFDPLRRLNADSLVFDAIRRGVAIYSPHTALDSADGGTNDMLADAIGLTERGPLRSGSAEGTDYKLVVFVPSEHVEAVSAAIFTAGAGQIGRYSSCSFRTPGTGTFFGQEGTKPAVGRSGQMQTVEEIRLETIVPRQRAGAVVAALRQSHPYEEPAFDLHVLANPGGQGLSMGTGRIGRMPPTNRAAILARIKRELELAHLAVAGPTDGSIATAAVCAGSGGAMLDDALRGGAQLFLSGEIRHHDALRSAAAGMTVVCTLHSNSERPVLKRLKKRLEETAAMPPIQISAADRDPYAIV
jgi:dinuclear metal center YbgI/SA1388 family protein